jgi:predicted metal-dependent HD superfamily phosphohydrolase
VPYVTHRLPRKFKEGVMSTETLFGSWHWRVLMTQAGIQADFMETFREFEKVYSELGRHYHTLRHILDCLDEFAGVQSLAEN